MADQQSGFLSYPVLFTVLCIIGGLVSIRRVPAFRTAARACLLFMVRMFALGYAYLFVIAMFVPFMAFAWMVQIFVLAFEVTGLIAAGVDAAVEVRNDGQHDEEVPSVEAASQSPSPTWWNWDHVVLYRASEANSPLQPDSPSEELLDSNVMPITLAERNAYLAQCKW